MAPKSTRLSPTDATGTSFFTRASCLLRPVQFLPSPSNGLVGNVASVAGAVLGVASAVVGCRLGLFGFAVCLTTPLPTPATPVVVPPVLDVVGRAAN